MRDMWFIDIICQARRMKLPPVCHNTILLLLENTIIHSGKTPSPRDVIHICAIKSKLH